MQFKTSQVLVTPKKAEEFLRINTYPGQRTLSPTHVSELAAKMKDGRFHEGQIAIVHNGEDILANGQHQCTASISSGQKFNSRLLEYTVEKGDSKEDVARVFAQFNVDRARNRGDIAWIYGCQIGMQDWPRRCVTICNSALGWIATGFGEGGRARMGRDENSRLLSAKKASCQFVHDTIFVDNAGNSYAKSRHLMRAPVAAAMIVTHAKAASDAEVFWASVRDGDMLKRNDPCFVLRECLLRSALNNSASERGNRAQVSARELFGKCIHGWNAYRQKATTVLRFYFDKPLPKAV